MPGTTRDVLRERIHIAGMPLHLLDTAGLRASSDVIEAEGVRRAHAEMRRADHILFLVDGAADPAAHSFLEARATLPAQVPVTVILNKSDLARSALPEIGVACLHLSALTGAGLEPLRELLAGSMGFQGTDGGALSARARHVRALALAHTHLDEADRQLRARRAGELVAEELRLAQRALGEITGEVSTEELLGRIFASFCIGK
jgi:tRNA modification GTPase